MPWNWPQNRTLEVDRVQITEETKNFDLADEQKDVIKGALKFAKKKSLDLHQESDQEEKSQKHLWEKCCEVGSVRFFIPGTYAGAGLGYLELGLINEELWRVDPGVTHLILVGTIKIVGKRPKGDLNEDKTEA